MIRFLLGLPVAPVLVMLWAWRDVTLRMGWSGVDRLDDVTLLALRLVVVPTLAGGIAATSIHAIAPRRDLDRRTGGGAPAFVLGVLSGATGLLLAIVPIAFTRHAALDIALCAIGAILAAGITLLVRPGIARGRCVGCGYDLAGGAGAALCPECGRPVLATGAPATACDPRRCRRSVAMRGWPRGGSRSH